jgi:hypothetical protein
MKQKISDPNKPYRCERWENTRRYDAALFIVFEMLGGQRRRNPPIKSADQWGACALCGRT